MGWTFCQRFPGMSHKEFFDGELGPGIIDVASGSGHPKEIYIAYQIQDGEDKGLITCIVCLIENRAGYHNFGYKDMDESMAPICYHCPERILNLLSPVELFSWPDHIKERMQGWRDHNWRNVKDRDRAKSIVPGNIIYFPKPLSFGRYGEYNIFLRLKDRNRYQAYRMSGGILIPCLQVRIVLSKYSDYEIFSNFDELVSRLEGELLQELEATIEQVKNN